MTLALSLLGSIFVNVANASCAAGVSAQKLQTIQRLATDMRLPHEGSPHGVPESYGWTKRPRLAMANNPGKFKSMVAWGQVYEAVEGSLSTNTRIQIKDMRAYQLSKSDLKWRVLQSSRRVEGAAYREDFLNNANQKADQRTEPDGSISVKLSKNYNYHFWPATSRVNINPSDIRGLLVTVYARLIPDRAQARQDFGKARYVLDVGGDYWSSQTANWNNFKTNGEIGMGRFKYLTKNWQMFSMTTLSQSELMCYPPPI